MGRPAGRGRIDRGTRGLSNIWQIAYARLCPREKDFESSKYSMQTPCVYSCPNAPIFAAYLYRGTIYTVYIYTVVYMCMQSRYIPGKDGMPIVERSNPPRCSGIESIEPKFSH